MHIPWVEKEMLWIAESLYRHQPDNHLGIKLEKEECHFEDI